jgi:hypothetical protein
MMQITCAFEFEKGNRMAQESKARSKDFFMSDYFELQTYMIFFKNPISSAKYEESAKAATYLRITNA